MPSRGGRKHDWPTSPMGWQLHSPRSSNYGTEGAEFRDLREYRAEDARKGREAIRRHVAAIDRGDFDWHAVGRLRSEDL